MKHKKFQKDFLTAAMVELIEANGAMRSMEAWDLNGGYFFTSKNLYERACP